MSEAASQARWWSRCWSASRTGQPKVAASAESGLQHVSGSEERRGYDGDAVGASVGRLSGCDDGGVGEVFSELVAQPDQVTNVAVVDDLSELDLERDDLAAAFDDQVHFTIAAPGAQVRDLRFGFLGVYAHAQGD